MRGKAELLRKRGLSVRQIEEQLKIPRSTLSGWLRNIRLSPAQKKVLNENCKEALVSARKRAVLWHKEQKGKRIDAARQGALNFLNNIDVHRPEFQELALAVLYMAEGRKVAEETSLGSSDPLMLKFFLGSLKKLYGIDINKISCSLHLRADQSEEELRRFWSIELGLPLNKFKEVYKDNRTIGSKTYDGYKGVCSIRYGSIAIKRRLLFLSQLFCERLVMGS